jgi:hypothetical protein
MNTNTGFKKNQKMKYLYLLLPIVLLSSFRALDWQEFTSLQGKFKILTPGTFEETVTKRATSLDTIVYHSFVYKPKEKSPDNEFYVVNYYDFPAGSFPEDSTETIKELYRATIESSTQSVKGFLMYEADTETNFHKGKVWRVSYNKSTSIIKSKCFLWKDRFYLIQTMTLRPKSLNTSADKFLDSFKFLE